MDYSTIILDKKDNIAVLTLNRPEKLNALNNQTLIEMKDALTSVQHDDKIYVLIITGSGKKAFAAGADIEELNKLNVLSGKKFTELGQSVFSQIENLGKPVIAAVNGYALGGGCELALACHIRLAAEGVKFGQPEVNLGIIPAYGGTQRLSKLINKGRALEYILTSEMITVEEAFRIGLVNRIFSENELLPEAIKMGQKIASKGQVAVKMCLKAIVTGNELSLKEGQHIEASLFAVLCGTEDFKEGTGAFLEKRQPVFHNK
jgi:enoyl-CoA hydratase